MSRIQKSIRVSKTNDLPLDKDYIGFLEHVQKRLQNAQLKAARSVSTEQIHFYWELGSDIIKQQTTKRWGSHFLDQLSLDMRNVRPGMQGFSKRNLEYMRLLATVYPSWDDLRSNLLRNYLGHIYSFCSISIKPTPPDSLGMQKKQ